jgi:hypothetical protein
MVEQLIGPFLAEIEEEIKSGRLPHKNARHFVVSMLSLCVFPFVARPMIQTVLGFDDEVFNQFLNERKVEVPKLLLRGYRSENNEKEGAYDE